MQTELLSPEDTFQPLLSAVVIVMLCGAREHRYGHGQNNNVNSCICTQTNSALQQF